MVFTLMIKTLYAFFPFPPTQSRRDGVYATQATKAAAYFFKLVSLLSCIMGEKQQQREGKKGKEKKRTFDFSLLLLLSPSHYSKITFFLPRMTGYTIPGGKNSIPTKNMYLIQGLLFFIV